MHSIKITGLSARNSLERPVAGLDAPAMVAVEWAAHWFSLNGQVRPQPAVVIRQALVHYARHLADLSDPASINEEVVMLRTAAKGRGTARGLTEARARIEAAAGKPLGWLEALHSPQSQQMTRDLEAAFEALEL